jgi:hypothetical protein
VQAEIEVVPMNYLTIPQYWRYYDHNEDMEMHIVPTAYVISDQHMLLLPPFHPVAPVMLLGILFLSLPVTDEVARDSERYIQ